MQGLGSSKTKNSLTMSLVLLLLLSVFAPSGIVQTLEPERGDSGVLLDSSNRGDSTFYISEFYPAEDWQTSTPNAQGLNRSMLDELVKLISNNAYPIDGVVIIRNGYLVLEYYPNSLYDEDNLHSLYSVTKSVMSALVGIAIDQGLIESVDEKVIDFFPERTIANLDGRKENMTIEHLLTMMTGFQWDEWDVEYGHPDNDYTQLLTYEDPVQYMLDLPMVAEPGDDWVYCSGASHLLSAIINITSGRSTLDFASEYLFEPIGISNSFWFFDEAGLHLGGHGLNLTPKDMARFGYLYLHNGSWGVEQVVSAEWVVQSTLTHHFLSSEVGYAYQWWTYPEDDIFRAAGYRGQKIFVIPEEDMVVVFTATITDEPINPDSWLYEYILSSVLESTAVPLLPSPEVLVIALSIGVIVPLIVVSSWLHRRKEQ